MSSALQVYHTGFDSAYFKLSVDVRTRIENKIDDMDGGWSVFHTIVLLEACVVVFVLETIELFTPLTLPKV